MDIRWITALNNAEDGVWVQTYNLYRRPILWKGAVVFFYGGLEREFENRPSSFLGASVYGREGDVQRALFRVTPKKKHPPIAAQWEVAQEDGSVFLDTGRYFKESGAVDAQNKYLKLLRFSEVGFEVAGESVERSPMVFNDAKTYTFGELEVAIPKKSTRKLVCKHKHSGETVWEFHFVAYLYTEIIEREGILYFGTSGWGGHFYGVRLADGALVLDINTRGTEHFTVHEGKIYMVGEGCGLLRYDPASGSQELLQLPKKIGLVPEVDFLIADGNLYAAAYLSKKDRPLELFAVCIEL